MRKYAIVAVGLLLSLVLGATVFREPIAWAAQSVSATIAGPLDSHGNVAVHEMGTAAVHEQADTQLVATGTITANNSLNVDISGYREVRISTGPPICSSGDLLVAEAVEGGGTYLLDGIDFCTTLGISKAYDVAGRTLHLFCLHILGTCASTSVDVAVFGRTD
jgi:stage V sporulation protein SpoVS